MRQAFLRKTLITVALLPFASSGCADGADGGVHAQVDTLQGNRVEVRNTGESVWSPDAAWRLEEDLRLGTIAGDDDPEQFGSIAAIESDSRGRIYVLDFQALEIRAFDSTGAFSHSIGREGSGPGEFMFARSLSMGPGDTLVVRDDGTGRYTVFGPGGELVGTHTRPIVGTNSSISDAVLRDGSYVDWAPEFPDGRFGARMELQPIRYSPGFEDADTLPPVEHVWKLLPSGMPQTYFTAPAVGTIAEDGGIWFADSDEYRVHRRAPLGDTTLTFTLPATGVLLGEREREVVRSTVSNPDRLAEVLATLPERLPVVQAIGLDGEGHVFVLARVERDGDEMVVDVFREDGFYLGRMELPVSVPNLARTPPIFHATSTHLYMVTTDEFDVPLVSRLRIAIPE